MKKIILWIAALPVLAFAAEPSLLEEETLYIKEICETIDHKLGKEKESLRASFGVNVAAHWGPIECGGGGGFSYKYWHTVDALERTGHLEWEIGEKGYICTIIYDENYNLIRREVEFISEQQFVADCREGYKDRPGMANICERPEG